MQTAKTVLVFVLVAGLVTCGLPRPSSSRSTLTRGALTSDDAAALPASDAPAPASGTVARAAQRGVPVLAFGAMAVTAEPDTTEFAFPDDGERHLARDITVWVIASAFVAYFIIKVFIEQDDEQPVDNSPPGKKI